MQTVQTIWGLSKVHSPCSNFKCCSAPEVHCSTSPRNLAVVPGNTDVLVSTLFQRLVKVMWNIYSLHQHNTEAGRHSSLMRMACNERAAHHEERNVQKTFVTIKGKYKVGDYNLSELLLAIGY